MRSTFARVTRGWLSARAGARLDTLMSAEVVHHLVQLPYRHFERTPSGVIAERLRQLDVLRGFLTGQMPVLAIDLVFVVLFLGAAFAISITLGVIAAAAIPVLIGRLPPTRAQRRLADENFQAGVRADARRDCGQRRHHQGAWPECPRSRTLAGARAVKGNSTNFRPIIWPTSRPALRVFCSSWRCLPSSSWVRTKSSTIA